jgi:hypothetical protein
MAFKNTKLLTPWMLRRDVHPKFLRGLCTKVFTWEGTLRYDFVEMKSQIRSHRTVLELGDVWIPSQISRFLVMGVCLCASSCINFALLLLVSYTHSASSLDHNTKRRKRVSCILLRLVLATSKKTAYPGLWRTFFSPLQNLNGDN